MHCGVCQLSTEEFCLKKQKQKDAISDGPDRGAKGGWMVGWDGYLKIKNKKQTNMFQVTWQAEVRGWSPVLTPSPLDPFSYKYELFSPFYIYGFFFHSKPFQPFSYFSIFPPSQATPA